ncbi:hypothetical protein [Wenyingzhuangia sp. IMCC45574]
MTLYDLAFSPINAPLTYFLIALTVYRIITTLLGFDFDLDVDVDVDMDIDVDADIEVDADTSIDSTAIDLEEISNIELKNETVVRDKRKELKWWQIVLIYFNFTELPFMFTFTTWIFFWWFITLVGTYLTFSYDNGFGFVVFLIAIIPSLIINKIFTTPFKAFFKKLNRKGDAPIDFIGRKAILDSNISGDKMGRAKIKIESDPLLIYVKSLSGEELKTGTEILIIKQDKNKKYYYVQQN